MKINSVDKNIIFYIETDEQGWNYYTRHSSINWTLRMGESDEVIYDENKINQLEKLFQNYENKNII